MRLLQFPWPCLPTSNVVPEWNGANFRTGDTTTPVVIYASAQSHWSDDLNLIHESEAGHGDHPIDRASRGLAIRTLRRYLSEAKGLVLDAGCSSGFLLKDLRRTMPSLELVGADYIPGPLHRLAQCLPGVPMVQFDLRESPLPSDQFDAIVCLNVLEHIDRDDLALSEVRRMLKPGGIAHLEVPACPSCYDIYDEYLMHHRRYTRGELLDKARAAGFRVLSATHLGALVFPAFYVAKRRNRLLLKLSVEAKAQKVRGMMRSTRNSLLMRTAVGAELLLGRVLTYPFGIRCVAVLQKI